MTNPTERSLGDIVNDLTTLDMDHRLVIEEHHPNKIVTVTGIKHIICLPNTRSFYQRVIDLNPDRYVLW